MEDGEKKNLVVSLEDILTFATGANAVPPMGWSEHPSIVFKPVDDGGSDLPSASTCINALYLPTVHYNNYDKFKYKLLFAITCSVGFGMV